MKKALCFSAVVVVLSASMVMAQMSVDVVRTPGYYYGTGGEFTLTSTGDPIPGSATSWQSFCLERNEPVSSGNNYNLDIGTAAINGGTGGPNPDPIGFDTAYLYTQFLDNTLSDYDYNPGFFERRLSAMALQEAIWFLEDEISAVSSVQAALWIAEAQAAGWTDTGDIYVANLWTYDDCQRRFENQSMLMRSCPAVPAPGAVLLSGIGIGIVGWLRRRRSN